MTQSEQSNTNDTPKKGFTKENVKKLFTWKGGWEEWFWIIFFALLFFMYWGYKQDMAVCKQIQQEEADFYNNLIRSYNNWTINHSITENKWTNFIFEEPNETIANSSET